MAEVIVSIDDLPEATSPSGYLILQDAGVTKKLLSNALLAEPALAAHTSDTVDAHAASAVSFIPTGTIASITVQTALAELDARFVVLTQAQYDALTPPDPTTIYFVVG